ncbi:MAG: phosphatidate cytidylyltransferase [Planctomycetes bacterium]|nr:phosphatidate cytidylyltransferase [Planctomycetota bacterium]
MISPLLPERLLAAQAPAPSKARRLLIRVIGAPILLAALFAIVWLDYRFERVVAVRFLVAAASALGTVELLLMMRGRGHAVLFAPVVVLVAAPMLPWSWMLARPVAVAFLPAAALFVTCVLSLLVFRHGAFTVEAAALSIAAFAYMSLMNFACSPPPPVAEARFAWFILFAVAANKGSDMAAFVAGKSVGRHKMTPALSPNKTWEGAAAGGIVGTAAAFAVLRWTPIHADFARVPDWALLALALSVTIASQIGDLVESAFKRWADVKDSGRLLPEFGGILDMMDSFIVSVPVAFAGSVLLSRIFP